MNLFDKDSLAIRKIEFEDFQHVFELLKQLWPDNQRDFQKMLIIFKRNLDSDYKRHICAEHQKRIIGYCSLTIKNSLWQQERLGNIDELVIDENFRGQGIGSLLLEEMTSIAKKEGCVQLELDSGLHRERAHKFYRGAGFSSRAYLFTKSIR